MVLQRMRGKIALAGEQPLTVYWQKAVEETLYPAAAGDPQFAKDFVWQRVKYSARDAQRVGQVMDYHAAQQNRQGQLTGFVLQKLTHALTDWARQAKSPLSTMLQADDGRAAKYVVIQSIATEPQRPGNITGMKMAIEYGFHDRVPMTVLGL